MSDRTSPRPSPHPSSLSGQADSELVAAASVLAVVVLFRPVSARVQRAVDPRGQLEPRSNLGTTVDPGTGGMMMTDGADGTGVGADAGPTRTSPRVERAVRAVAIGVGVVFVVAGLWAFVDPRSFFEAAAVFEPYNEHFVRDLGAFQVGLGAVLLLAPFLRDALVVALGGVGIGAALHAVSHVIDRDLGGDPAVDIPLFAVIALLLLGAAVARAVTRRSD